MYLENPEGTQVVIVGSMSMGYIYIARNRTCNFINVNSLLLNKILVWGKQVFIRSIVAFSRLEEKPNKSSSKSIIFTSLTFKLVTYWPPI